MGGWWGLILAPLLSPSFQVAYCTSQPNVDGIDFHGLGNIVTDPITINVSK